MSIYGDKKDYEELVKESIAKANLLYGLSDEQKNEIIELLKQKEEIMKKNGLFANYQLKKINKKIQAIKKL